jgi:Zn-finger nucleic acid-binding protein
MTTPYRTPSEEDAHCFLCGSEGPAGATCATCLVERPALHSESARTLRCPRCVEPLVAMHVGGGAHADVCTRCHGILASPRAWSRLWRVPEAAADLERRFPSRAKGPSLTPLVSCPTCRSEMEMDRARFAATSDVVIDVCARGHGIWLDAGELGRVLAYADHKARIGDEAAQREAEETWMRAHRSEEIERRIALEVSLVEGESAGRRYSDGVVRAAGKRLFFEE